ncbi:MAG TPA: MaoC family dehydratase [Acidimicrobiales bacterium]|nr:MaoC family dehydratase [Acidimicrobiales bacterium]
MATLSVTARNGATASENKIHDDAVARRYGFGGGLVPGVTLYGYMTRPVVEHFGVAWLEGGTMEVRFDQPVYDGQEVTVGAEETAPGELTLQLRNPDGVVCSRGRATLPPVPGAPPEAADYPVVEAPEPERRPPADQTSLAPGTALATLWAGAHAGNAGPLLDLLQDPLPVYTEGGLAHPGHLILAANGVLTASVVLGPWIHVGSAVTNFASVADGTLVETRARVADRYERKGHHFVVLDVVWLAEGQVAMHASHTAIYRLRGGTMDG